MTSEQLGGLVILVGGILAAWWKSAQKVPPAQSVARAQNVTPNGHLQAALAALMAHDRAGDDRFKAMEDRLLRVESRVDEIWYVTVAQTARVKADPR